MNAIVELSEKSDGTIISEQLCSTVRCATVEWCLLSQPLPMVGSKPYGGELRQHDKGREGVKVT
jgi:hypothetical protein